MSYPQTCYYSGTPPPGRLVGLPLTPKLRGVKNGAIEAINVRGVLQHDGGSSPRGTISGTTFVSAQLNGIVDHSWKAQNPSNAQGVAGYGSETMGKNVTSQPHQS